MEQAFVFSSQGIQYLQGTLRVLYTKWFRFGKCHLSGRLLTILYHHPPLPCRAPFQHRDNVSTISVIRQLNWVQVFLLIPWQKQRDVILCWFLFTKDLLLIHPISFRVCFVLFCFPVNNKEMYLLTQDFLQMAACLTWFEAVVSDIGGTAKLTHLWIRMTLTTESPWSGFYECSW